MRWNVEGADARTGKDRLVTVEAESSDHAEAVARSKGMLVAAVHPVKVLSPADKLDQMMSGKLDASTVTTTTLIEQMTAAASTVTSNVIDAATDPAPLDYRGASVAGVAQGTRSSPVRFAADRPLSDPPAYLGLKIAAMVLAVVAALSYLAGVLSFTVAMMGFVESFYMRSSAGAWLSAIVGLLGTLVPIAFGAMLHAMSAGCNALRDIARNSFTHP